MLKAIELHKVSLQDFRQRLLFAAENLGQQQVPGFIRSLAHNQFIDIWQRSDWLVEPENYILIEMLRQLLLPDFEHLKGIHIAAIYGLYLLYLKEATGVANTLGVDISPFNVELAARAGAPIIRADAKQLPFADQSLDFVFSFHLMELGYMDFSSIDAILGQINRVLKPNGVFISDLESFNDPEVSEETWPSLGQTTLGLNGPLFPIEISRRYPFNLLHIRAFRKVG